MSNKEIRITQSCTNYGILKIGTQDHDKNLKFWWSDQNHFLKNYWTALAWNITLIQICTH